MTRPQRSVKRVNYTEPSVDDGAESEPPLKKIRRSFKKKEEDVEDVMRDRSFDPPQSRALNRVKKIETHKQKNDNPAAKDLHHSGDRTAGASGSIMEGEDDAEGSGDESDLGQHPIDDDEEEESFYDEEDDDDDYDFGEEDQNDEEEDEEFVIDDSTKIIKLDFDIKETISVEVPEHLQLSDAEIARGKEQLKVALEISKAYNEYLLDGSSLDAPAFHKIPYSFAHPRTRQNFNDPLLVERGWKRLTAVGKKLLASSTLSVAFLRENATDIDNLPKSLGVYEISKYHISESGDGDAKHAVYEVYGGMATSMTQQQSTGLDQRIRFGHWRLGNHKQAIERATAAGYGSKCLYTTFFQREPTATIVVEVPLTEVSEDEIALVEIMESAVIVFQRSSIYENDAAMKSIRARFRRLPEYDQHTLVEGRNRTLGLEHSRSTLSLDSELNALMSSAGMMITAYKSRADDRIVVSCPKSKIRLALNEEDYNEAEWNSMIEFVKKENRVLLRMSKPKKNFTIIVPNIGRLEIKMSSIDRKMLSYFDPSLSNIEARKIISPYNFPYKTLIRLNKEYIDVIQQGQQPSPKLKMAHEEHAQYLKGRNAAATVRRNALRDAFKQEPDSPKGKIWRRLKHQAKGRMARYRRDYREGRDTKGAAFAARQAASALEYGKRGARAPAESDIGRKYRARESRKREKKNTNMNNLRAAAAADPDSEEAVKLADYRAYKARRNTVRRNGIKAKEIVDKILTGTYVIPKRNREYTSTAPEKSKKNLSLILNKKKIEGYTREQLQARVVKLLDENSLHRLIKANKKA